jgi:hypothetical protein
MYREHWSAAVSTSCLATGVILLGAVSWALRSIMCMWNKLLAWIPWFLVLAQMVGSTHPHFKEEIDRGREWMNNKRKVS